MLLRPVVQFKGLQFTTTVRIIYNDGQGTVKYTSL